MMNFDEQEFIEGVTADYTDDGVEVLQVVPVSTNNGLTRSYVFAIRDGENIYAEVCSPVVYFDPNGEPMNFSFCKDQIENEAPEIACPPEILDLLTPAKTKEAQEWRKWSKMVYEGMYSGNSTEEGTS